MKKMNRKGFTLVELLAVIIILAIVVGITIPAVLTTTNNAKKKALETAAKAAADWIDRQYQISSSGLDEEGMAQVDANFSNFVEFFTDNKLDINPNGGSGGDSFAADSKKFITSAGLQVNNVKMLTVYVGSGTGRSCVKLTATSNGDYNYQGGSNEPYACGGSCSGAGITGC